MKKKTTTKERERLHKLIQQCYLHHQCVVKFSTRCVRWELALVAYYCSDFVLKYGVNNIFSNHKFFFFFFFPVVVLENTAALFCCEAPGMYYGLQNFTRLSIRLIFLHPLLAAKLGGHITGPHANSFRLAPAFLFFCIFPFQVFRRILQRCFTVPLQECFANHWHQGEYMMTEFSFLGELTLYINSSTLKTRGISQWFVSEGLLWTL